MSGTSIDLATQCLQLDAEHYTSLTDIDGHHDIDVFCNSGFGMLWAHQDELGWNIFDLSIVASGVADQTPA